MAYIQHRSLIDKLSFLDDNPPMLVKDLLQLMRPFLVEEGQVVCRDRDLGVAVFFLQVYCGTHRGLEGTMVQEGLGRSCTLGYRSGLGVGVVLWYSTVVVGVPWVRVQGPGTVVRV